MMSTFNCTPLAAIGDLSSGRIWAIVLGTLLAVVAVSLLIASWTKWGQTKSLTKCIALAFLAHVWLLMYAYGTRIVTPGFGGGTQGGARMESVIMSVPVLAMDEPQPTEEPPASDEGSLDKPKDIEPPSPWEAPLQRTSENNQPTSDARVDSAPEIPRLLPAAPKSTSSLAAESPLPDLPALDSVEQISQMASMPNQPAQATNPLQPIAPIDSTSRSVAQPSPPPVRRFDQQPVPMNYQMRLSPQRAQIAMQNGGDVNTEASVERALAWLARAQAPDGSWNASEHGAGNVTSTTRRRADNENRDYAGRKANTAMTGLALLAFLGAGHTHTEGRYRENVAAGLRYLLSQQFENSGDLSGRDQIGKEPTVRFARMYSHGMAALALAEAYGMTGDGALLTAIRSACEYSDRAMNPRTGGWRYEYRSDDPGDLSQFGWQAMLLNSASTHRSYQLSPESRFMMQRFLDSVSTGRHGGLAVYRPVPIQAVRAENATPAMTAEAMASRLLLGYPMTAAAAEEGQRMLLTNLPGRSEENLYYWYYATLAMYQLRGDKSDTNMKAVSAVYSSEAAWSQWNDAIKQQLCSTQVPRGPAEGSWNPSCVWGDYGGRVYSTAMACMCLEVYYRYLPMYKPEQFANQWQPARR
jgi:hypothetical protein